MQPKTIQEIIEKNLPHATAKIESNDEVHFNAIIISPEFLGKNRVERQQLVYKSLGQHIHDGSIHALSMKTFTPEEWATQKK